MSKRPEDVDTSELRVLSDLLDVLQIGLATGDEGQIRTANKAFCSLFGRRLDELSHAPSLASLLPADSRPVIAEVFSRPPGTTAVDRMQLCLLGKDDERIPVEVALQVEQSTSASAWVALVRDLRSEEEKQRLLERYMALLQRTPVGVILWDCNEVVDPVDLRLLTANAAAVRLLGLDLDQVTGRTMREVFPDVLRDDAARILALGGTDRVEHFGDVSYGDVIYRWRALGLPGNVAAAAFDDITQERAERLMRRELLERIVETGDAERRNLALSLHDDPVQQLAAASILVAGLLRHPESPDRDGRLEAVGKSLEAAMTSLRHLVFELSPPELVESGLESAIRSAAEYLFADVPTEVNIAVNLRREPPHTVQTAAFRIVAEALTNVLRHANAERVWVDVSDEGTSLALVIRDDGRGFDPRLHVPGHIGLRGMRERARALGGECTIGPAPEGRGTMVTSTLPVDETPLLLDLPPVWEHPLVESEVATLQRERDSLVVAASDARKRATQAESRLREAMRVSSMVLDPSLTPAQLAEVAANQIGMITGDGCAVGIVDDVGALRRVGIWHTDPAVGRVLDRDLFEDSPTFSGQAGTVLRTGLPVVLHRESFGWPTTAGRQPALGDRDLGSVIVAPLRLNHEVFGTLTVVREQSSPNFGEADTDFLMCMASHLAVAFRLAEQRSAVGSTE